MIIGSWCETNNPMFTRLKDFIKAWQDKLHNVKIALLISQLSHTQTKQQTNKQGGSISI